MKTTSKFMAIWLDHEKAYLIEPGAEPIIQTIHSSEKASSNVAGEEADGIRIGNFRSSNNEFSKHRKEENIFHLFCKNISAGIKNYDTLYILGSGTAHKEFRNYLKEDHHFKDKLIIEETTDHLTENQLKAKVNMVYTEIMA